MLLTQNLRNNVSLTSQIKNLIIQKYIFETIQVFVSGLIINGSQNTLKAFFIFIFFINYSILHDFLL